MLAPLLTAAALLFAVWQTRRAFVARAEVVRLTVERDRWRDAAGEQAADAAMARTEVAEWAYRARWWRRTAKRQAVEAVAVAWTMGSNQPGGEA